MATRTVIAHQDDTDGTPATETVRFGLDGILYEIDLSARNAAALRTTLERYRAAGRRTGGIRTRSIGSASAPSTRIDPAQLTAIRDWARRHGLMVSARGRVPRSVIELYNTAR